MLHARTLFPERVLENLKSEDFMRNISLNPKWFTFSYTVFASLSYEYILCSPFCTVYIEDLNCLQSWALQLELQRVMFLSLEVFCLFCGIG